MGLICDVWKIYDCEKFPVSFGRSVPRRIVSQVSAETSSLAFCRTPETMRQQTLGVVSEANGTQGMKAKG